MSTITNFAGNRYLSPSTFSQLTSGVNRLDTVDEFTPIDNTVASTGEVAEMARKAMEEEFGDRFVEGEPPVQSNDWEALPEGGSPCGHSLADSISAAFADSFGDGSGKRESSASSAGDRGARR